MTLSGSAPRDLFLLLTAPSGPARVGSVRRQSLVAGALAELAIAGRVELEGGFRPRVRRISSAPTGDAVLDHVLAALKDGPSRPVSSVIGARGADVTELVGRELEAVGTIGRKRGLLGTTWPLRDGAAVAAVQERLGEVVAGRAQPAGADVTVLGILRGQGLAHRVLGEQAEQLSRRQLNLRIDQLAPGDPAARAITRLSQARMAAAAST